jgi:hypothetical protein
MIEKAPRSKNEMSYDEALLYCQFLEYDSHRDWRLPTYTEWSDHADIWGWYSGDPEARSGVYRVVPVRSI